MCFARRLILWLPTLAVLLLPVTATAQQPAPSDPFRRSAMYLGPRREYAKSIASWRELKSRNVLMQQQEYTCGAASLATLLKFSFDGRITEQQVLEAALAKLSKEELKDRQENGLSMEDLANGASRLGYAAAVLEVKYEKLRAIAMPVIVRLEKDDFKHFVVFRGELGDRVFLADPLRGNVRKAVCRFLEEWDGKILAVVHRGQKPRGDGPLAIEPWAVVTPENEAARRATVGAPFPPAWIVRP